MSLMACQWVVALCTRAAELDGELRSRVPAAVPLQLCEVQEVVCAAESGWRASIPCPCGCGAAAV